MIELLYYCFLYEWLYDEFLFYLWMIVPLTALHQLHIGGGGGGV